MHTCISFTPTIQQSLHSKNNITKWNEATDSFDNKDYRKSFYAVFDYLDESILQHYANADKSEIVIPQGSAVVIINIDNESVSIRAPFVQLPADKQLPILRKCTEINFSSMALPQILLENNILTITYSMPLELCEPYKLYDILRDIGVNADKYDDEFVSKFGAVRIMEPQVTPYSDQQLQNIQDTSKAIATEALEYAAYFEGKRDLVLASDALFIGINRLRYYSNPTGMLSNKMSEAISTFYSRNVDMNSKIKAMRTVLESFKNITAEESKDTFYIAYQLIPSKGNASRSYLKDWIGTQYNDAESMFNKENYATATSYSLYTLYIILSDFNIDENSQKAIEYTLKSAAGKPFEEAAAILMKAMRFFHLNEEDALEMEEEKQEAANEAIASGDYMKNISSMMDQYKSMIGNFMSSFTKN
ncbi:MAG: hypothetical protein QM802_20445 [Agriterribacter sp.]